MTLLPGAVIERGCTIGAGALVCGSIPEYSVAVGVPARVIKRVYPNQDGTAATSKANGTSAEIRETKKRKLKWM